jgi:hypothetical protein
MLIDEQSEREEIRRRENARYGGSRLIRGEWAVD